MAAPMAQRRYPGEAVSVLESATSRRTGPGVADRLPTPKGADLLRKYPYVYFAGDVNGGAQSAESARRCNAVHDSAGRFSSAAESVQWTDGDRHRHANRGAQPAGTRRLDRLLRQHPGSP